MSILTAADGHAESALHAAAWAGDLPEVERLLASGANVNWQDSIGESALFGAVGHARMEVVRFLLTHGADARLVDLDGWSALHWAASHGGVAMIELLISHGADPRLADKSGRLPIDVARQYGKGDRVACLKRYGRTQFIQAEAASPDAQERRRNASAPKSLPFRDCP